MYFPFLFPVYVSSSFGGMDGLQHLSVLCHFCLWCICTSIILQRFFCTCDLYSFVMCTSLSMEPFIVLLRRVVVGTSAAPESHT